MLHDGLRRTLPVLLACTLLFEAVGCSCYGTGGNMYLAREGCAECVGAGKEGAAVTARLLS